MGKAILFIVLGLAISIAYVVLPALHEWKLVIHLLSLICVLYGMNCIPRDKRAGDPTPEEKE